MKVTFELRASDVRYFRDRLKAVRESGSSHEEDVIIRGASEMVGAALAAEPPVFVIERIAKLELLIEMLRDEEWALEGQDRVRILDALAYFVDPDDLIPDRVPGIGYLDDAIMIELVARELTHEIDAYTDFCEFRKRVSKSEGLAKLQARRQALQTRMRRRRRRERSSTRSGTRSSRAPLKLW